MKLYLYGIVGDSWDGLDSKSIAEQLDQAQPGEIINVHINSPGGYVTEGMAIYTLLTEKAREGWTVNCHVDGLAASMASIIALAGQSMTMSPAALYMIHNPWTVAVGDAPVLRKEAETLDRMKSVMVEIYSSKSNLDASDIAAVMDAETWYTAQEALEAGFASAVSGDTAQASVKDKRGAAAWKSKFESFGFQKVPDPELVLGALALGSLNKPAAVAAIQSKGNDMSKGAQDPAAKTPVDDNSPASVTLADAQAMASETAARAVADERARNVSIEDAVAKAGLPASFAKKLVNDGISVDQARVAIIDELAKNSDSAGVGHSAPIKVTSDELEKFEQGALAWMLTKAGAAEMVKKAAKMKGESIDLDPGEFRGARNADLARRSLELRGHRVNALTPDAVVQQALTTPRAEFITQTTGDFTVLLENTMNKILRSAYATTPDTWSQICAIGTAVDFRAHPRYRRGSFGALDSLNEAGEFRNRAIPDGYKEAITPLTKGNVINLSRQAIVNDDMSVFSGLATDLGRAAKLTIELDFYALLAANPTMSDGNPLFHASHGNIATAAAPSVTAFDAMRVLIASQTDVSGNEVLDYEPGVGLFPKSLGGLARVINGSEYDPDSNNKLQRKNMAYGILQNVVDTARLSGTTYYFFVDPAILPTFEVLFLDGVQEPFLDSQEGWRVDGSEWKVRLDYGMGATDWRGAVRNAGA